MDLTSLLPASCSLMIGLAMALGFDPLMALWDRWSLRKVEDLIALGRCVGINEDRVRLGLRGWGVALIVGPFLTYMAFRSPVLVPVTFVLINLAPRWMLRALIERRRRAMRDQLVPVCMTLANTTRAGLSLAQGLELMAPRAPDPIGAELTRMVRDCNGGRPLSLVLEDAADRIDLPGFRMLCASLMCCIEHGGPITETLDGLALVIQENQRLERKMETQSASGRMMLVTLAIFPVGFFGLNYLIVPEIASAFPGTLIGQCVLAVVITLIAISVRWGNSLLKTEART